MRGAHFIWRTVFDNFIFSCSSFVLLLNEISILFRTTSGKGFGVLFCFVFAIVLSFVSLKRRALSFLFLFLPVFFFVLWRKIAV